MSYSLLWAELLRKENLIGALRAQIAQLIQQRDEYLNIDSRRRTYPDGPRDKDGRRIGVCRRCGRERSMRAHSLCSGCYNTWRRHLPKSP